MFKNILVPVDLAERHAQALEVAANLAGQAGGRVTLLHVIEVIAGVAMDEEKDFYRRLETAARKHLDRLGQQLAAKKISWQGVTSYGHRGPEVVKHAQDNGSDLIVLTAPRIEPQSPATGWGSLSYKIGFFAPCPVLLVR